MFIYVYLYLIYIIYNNVYMEYYIYYSILFNSVFIIRNYMIIKLNRIIYNYFSKLTTFFFAGKSMIIKHAKISFLL